MDMDMDATRVRLTNLGSTPTAPAAPAVPAVRYQHGLRGVQCREDSGARQGGSGG